MAILDDFQRVSRSHPCPVCGRADWCLISRDDPCSPSKVICARVESAQPCAEAGWLHRLAATVPSRMNGIRFRHHRCVLRVQTGSEGLQQLAANCRTAATDTAVARLAIRLGLTPTALRRLGIGWASTAFLETFGTGCVEPGAWTFPMVDATNRVVGIRLRGLSGYKFAVRGSAQGIFVPTQLSSRSPLLLAEGPTDTAALLDLGFDAVGRPNCFGGGVLVREYLRAHRVRNVVVISDGDDPGRRGAEKLARELVPYCPCVRVIGPPDGIRDVREWKQEGATQKDLHNAFEKAPPRQIRIKSRTVKRKVP